MMMTEKKMKKKNSNNKNRKMKMKSESENVSRHTRPFFTQPSPACGNSTTKQKSIVFFKHPRNFFK